MRDLDDIRCSPCATVELVSEWHVCGVSEDTRNVRRYLPCVPIRCDVLRDSDDELLPLRPVPSGWSGVNGTATLGVKLKRPARAGVRPAGSAAADD